MLDAATLWELIEARAAATPDALLAVDEADRAMSFAQYKAAAERCAAGLMNRGITEESAVSWILPTRIEAIVLAGALSRLGAVQNPILPIYRHREVGFAVRESQAKLLVVPGTFRGFDFPEMAQEIAGEVSGLEWLRVDKAEELPDADPATLPAALGRASEDAAPVRWLFYTSGTTADPKGALHTDASIMVSGRSLVRVCGMDERDRIALVFPFTHVGGMGWFIAGLMVGCGQIVVETFDPATAIPLLAKHGVTLATAGTAFHQAYLDAQREQAGTALFPDIRSFPGGGAPKPPQLHYDIKREMGGAGIVSGYGLTECPIVAMNSFDDPDEKLAQTEGRANPPGEMQIKIVRLDGKLADCGEEGEIRVKGPQLCKGYLDPKLNQSAFDEDGFFRTGDLGNLDQDDFLTITGRLKDVIIRKGENISAKEVEDLLYQHPKVADVAVIGLPDVRSGERCCAVVQCVEPGEPLEFEEMVAFLKDQNLMLQKIPEQLELIDEIPRNPTGKIPKHNLRARYSN
ncbi:MAG: AMP-binding protein [Deltaproteobacteria bacterium]|nr:AMP-binding protein [Deltaproteobacteria bacterium]